MTPLTDIVLYLAGRQYVRQQVLIAAGFSAHDLVSLHKMRILSRRIDYFGNAAYRYRRFTEKVSFKAAA